MKMAFSINFLAKIFIVGNDDPVFVVGFPNDLVIRHPLSLVKY